MKTTLKMNMTSKMRMRSSSKMKMTPKMKTTSKIEMLSKHPSSTKVKNNNCISSQMYSAGAYSTVSCLFSVSIKTGGGLMVWNYDMIPPIKFTDLSGPNFLDPILLCLWSRNHNFHLQTWVVGTGCTTHGGNTYNICLHF